jgi:hypothetical protein
MQNLKTYLLVTLSNIISHKAVSQLRNCDEFLNTAAKEQKNIRKTSRNRKEEERINWNIIAPEKKNQNIKR